MHIPFVSGMIEADHKSFVGSQLKIAREALGIPGSELMRRYGFPPGGKLTNWEKGDNYPSPWFLARLCSDYGFTIDWFYRGVLAGVSSELAENLRRGEAGMTAVSRAEKPQAAKKRTHKLGH